MWYLQALLWLCLLYAAAFMNGCDGDAADVALDLTVTTITAATTTTTATMTLTTTLTTTMPTSDVPLGTCVDYTQQYNSYEEGNKVFGATDVNGNGCDFYTSDASECRNHEDWDFLSNEMCCSCGGGSTYMAGRSLAVNKASIVLSGAECPSGFTTIATLAACRAALDMLGIAGWEYAGDETDATWPAGCYYCDSTPDCGDGVWFNMHSIGQSVSGTQRLCQKNYNISDVEMLFVGDSDIDYWDSAVAFPGSFNVGIGGYTTKEVAQEVDTWVAELDPKWVVIVVGENDLDGTRQVTEKALTRFQTIVGKFMDDGARVIYLGTKPEPDTANLHDEYKYYDAAIQTYAAEQAASAQDPDKPPFQMIDVFNNFTSDAELYNSDNLHMSRLGYMFWNSWVKLVVESDMPCYLWRGGVCIGTP